MADQLMARWILPVTSSEILERSKNTMQKSVYQYLLPVLRIPWQKLFRSKRTDLKLKIPSFLCVQIDLLDPLTDSDEFFRDYRVYLILFYGAIFTGSNFAKFQFRETAPFPGRYQKSKIAPCNRTGWAPYSPKNSSESVHGYPWVSERIDLHT